MFFHNLWLKNLWLFQLQENARSWGKERADMNIRMNEAEHGFGRSGGLVLHDYPVVVGGTKLTCFMSYSCCRVNHMICNIFWLCPLVFKECSLITFSVYAFSFYRAIYTI